VFLFLFVNGFSQSSTLNGASIGAQKSGDPLSSFSFGLQGTFHHGAILPHRKEVNEIVEGHTSGVELSVLKATIGKKRWQQLYQLPQVGISALAINLGNPNELGFGYGLFPFVVLPITQHKINWNIKIGYGLGVIEKPFHKKENNKNVAIGSHLNAIIYFNSMLNLQLVKELAFSAGVSFLHYSNGSSARPNLGINILSLTSGLRYTFGKKEVFTQEIFSESAFAWNNKVTLGMATKEVSPIDGPQYWVSTLSFNRMKSRTEKSSFGFSADLFYNSSLSDLMARDSSITSSGLDNFRVGIIGLYSFDFGKVSVLLGAGAYVYSKYKDNGVVYNKLETRYWVSDQLFLRLGVKTHLVSADFVEYGIGYKF